MSLRIAILGGGTAGWMTANLLAHRWSGAQITLIEAPDIATIGVGEGSTPTLKRFFEVLGVEEEAWMPACCATYKASIRFRGWSPASGVADYSHPFLTQTDLHTEEAFTLNCRNRRLGFDVPTRPDDFMLGGVLAAQGKAPLAPAHFPFRMEYGYHFDAALLGAFLRDLAALLETQGDLSHFRSASWHCLLAGYGAFPPLAQTQRDDVDFYRDRDLARFLQGCSLNFPPHGHALAQMKKVAA